MPTQSTLPSETLRGGANAFSDGTSAGRNTTGTGETAVGTYGVLRWTQTA
jgi:hypothetical protein